MEQSYVASEFEVGMQVEIHGLTSPAGLRFNDCRGVIKQINADGRRVVRLHNSDSLPVVKPANLRKAAASSSHGGSTPVCFDGVVKIYGLTSEGGRSLNGLFGRVTGKPNAAGRLVVEICATGQRKALKDANLIKVPLDDVFVQAQGLLDQGRLHDMQRLLSGLPGAPDRLVEALSMRLSDGTHSEILSGSLKPAEIAGKGKGYRAARDIVAGEALLFDTAFCTATEGPKEYHIMEAQCKAKTGGAGRFLAADVMALETGHGMVSMFSASELQAILKNNVFRTIRDPEHVALYVAASRFNHSCCANAFADTSKSQVIVRALRNIDAGEEVCISYVPIMEPREDRQRHLEGKGFVCRCPRCEEEERNDPKFSVPCTCARHKFSAQANASLIQKCPSCGFKFSKKESLSHLQKLKDMNEFMRTPAAAAANPLDLIPKLEPLVASIEGTCTSSSAPKMHTHAVQLLNNLSGVHYFAATRVPGPHQGASSVAAYSYKRKVMDAMAASHGDGSRQRDLNYFQGLYRMLMGDFPSPEDRVACEKELEELCLLHFGQASLPSGISNSVCR